MVSNGPGRCHQKEKGPAPGNDTWVGMRWYNVESVSIEDAGRQVLS